MGDGGRSRGVGHSGQKVVVLNGGKGNGRGGDGQYGGCGGDWEMHCQGQRLFAFLVLLLFDFLVDSGDPKLPANTCFYGGKVGAMPSSYMAVDFPM